MVEFDPGPPPAFASLFASVPDHEPHREHFWIDWGPIFYRGRLDGTARLLCIASDPGATERIAGRTLVGDAGQRVQGFLTKLGLTRSYLCLNAFVYGMFPSHFFQADEILAEEDQTAWRNAVFDLAKTPQVQAVVAFGSNARLAAAGWTGRGDLPLVEVHHPSFPDEDVLLEGWRHAVTELRALVTPDPDGDATGPNYGQTFTESEYAPIPSRDLPFGVPAFLGDDRWRREATPPGRTSVERPFDDLLHTLVWHSPDGSGGGP
jgi:hypothetical protein